MLFDDQADRFDDRAGLPAGVPEKVARAVLALARLAPGQGLLEIGVGTGEVGRHLAAAGHRYVGIDLSFPMLKRYRSQCSGAMLAQADGDAGWPARTGSLGAVFGLRSLHFIRPDHLASELERAGGKRCVFLLGSVVRAEGSVKEIMRHKMRSLLREAGYQGRGGRRWKEALWKAMADRGTRLEATTVAAWTASATPRRSLMSWSGKGGLAGLELPDAAKQTILSALEGWALEKFGSLDIPQASEERYVLDGMEFGAGTLPGK